LLAPRAAEIAALCAQQQAPIVAHIPWAAMSLCRLYQATGPAKKSAAARAQLGEVYAWFTEGLDTADLQEATALLTET